MGLEGTEGRGHQGEAWRCEKFDGLLGLFNIPYADNYRSKLSSIYYLALSSILQRSCLRRHVRRFMCMTMPGPKTGTQHEN